MSKLNILLLCGGGGSEHAISLISAEYFEQKIQQLGHKCFKVEIKKDGSWSYENNNCEIGFEKTLKTSHGKNHRIDLAIPCIHGHPGETGDIQAFLEILKIPYFGCDRESHYICFNKLLTKLMLKANGVNIVPFKQVKDDSDVTGVKEFLKQHGSAYLKATNQGSSIGCYRIDDSSEIQPLLTEAFSLSPFVIIEKEIQGRELEVAFFEYQGKKQVSAPGEIITPQGNYTYEEKYNENSKTLTVPKAQNISDSSLKEIQAMALETMKVLKLRHMSRIDFFMENKTNKVYVNEVNTIPGHTKISMFPMMLEESGVKYEDYLQDCLKNIIS